MEPSGTGLYTWTPARHASRLDSDAAHRRRARRLASQATPPEHQGRLARLGAWFDQLVRAPAVR